MSDPLVSVRDVFCVHRAAEGDAAALQGASLDVEAGELVCVLGPSGAGKSTLLRVIAGLQTPSAGSVSVAGHDIGRLPVRRRARLRHALMGFVGQRASAVLSPDLGIAAAVALPLALRGAGRAEQRRRAAELLDALGLRDRAQARPAELSGGERQRVVLAVALAHRPALLLADEPTGELDAVSAKRVRDEMTTLARAHGASVVLVSHDPASPAGADRAVQIRDGRIAQESRNGRSAVVVGRGGWVQLPAALLERAGIGSRVRIEARADGVLLRPVGGTASAQGGGGAPTPALPVSAPRFAPARVEVSGLERARGMRRILEGLTVSFTAGQLTVVTGRSGAGKSTLLRILAGLERGDGGRVSVDAQALERADAEALAALRRQRIGYVAQDPVPVAFLSARENVALALRLRGWPPAAASARADTVLGWFGLGERTAQRAGRLSAGELQRVALARALAGARGLLLADEPTSRLDAAAAARVGDLLRLAADREGQTVICATHEPELIRRADRVVELSSGSPR